MSNEALSQLKRYCNESDNAAFNQFYRSHSGKLWQFLINRGCNEQNAYDLLAEAFIKFIKVVCRDLKSPVALLYRITINLQIDHYRKDKRSPLSYDNEQVDSYPDKAYKFKDEKELTSHLLNKLPIDEQNLMFMRYWTGLTHKEIARIMDIPEGTIRRQNAAIIKKLQQYWQEDANGT
ncbi:MAG: RNA polymerase sigma factor [Pseudomonadota bacterium]